MLKKICVTACLAFTLLWVLVINSLAFVSPFDKPYELYLRNNSSNATIVGADGVLLKDMLNVKGGSFNLNDGQSAEQILLKLKARVVAKEVTEYGTSIYAYSHSIRFRKTINQKVVNVHIFVGKGYSMVGVPLLYGSF